MDRPFRILTFSGRTDRLEYFWNVAVAAVVAPVVCIILILAGLAFQSIEGTVLLLWLVFTVAHLAAAVRRFHDFGFSAILPIALLTIPVLLPAAPIAMVTCCDEYFFGPQVGVSDDGRWIGSAVLAGELAITVFPIATIAFFALALIPGSPSANRYGPPPWAAP
ncbi:MAG: DUF805 domain-containing protein [Gemmobacter sp.]